MRSRVDLGNESVAESSLNKRLVQRPHRYGRLKGSPLMGIKKMALVAALGLSMASAPVMAQTASVERSAPVLAQANGQSDDGVETTTTTYVIAFFVIVAIGLGLYFAFNDDNDGQKSP